MHALKLALRTLLRDRMFTVVNVIGLSLGIMSYAFIFIYTYHNLTYDTYHTDIENIYRVNTTWLGADNSKSMAITAPLLATTLISDYSFTKGSATISAQNEQLTISAGSHEFVARNFRLSTPGILDVFTFEFLAGTPETALLSEKQIIINKSWAEKLYHTTNCLDKKLTINGEQFVVKGVYKDWPQNIDLPIEGVISASFPQNWDMFGFITYVNVESGSGPLLTRALTELSEVQYTKNEIQSETLLLQAQPLVGLHFAESILMDQPKGNKSYVYLSLTAGCILVLIILVNISNLGIIRAVDGIKQVGLRKILGASTFHLIGSSALQFIVMFGISWIIGITLFQLISPTFYEYTGITINTVEHLGLLSICIGSLLMLVLLVGAYTDRLSIRIDPITALKNRVSSSLPGSSLRKVLVVFQFIVTGIVVSALVILLTQWSYIRSKDLGFDTSGVMVVSIQNPKIEITPLKNELQNMLGEKNVSLGSWGSLPGSDVPFTTAHISQANEIKEIPVNVIDYDQNFLEVFDIPLLKGMSNQPDQILINQAMAMKVADPINARISLPWIQSARVGGIIMDYHYKSLHNQVEPLILIPQEGSTHITHIYLKGQIRDFRAVDEAIRHHWEPASYKLEFVDEKLMTNYQKEKEAISIIFYFSALSLFISILGLFGVMTYILKRRLYEIGIRKVLGAEVKDLLRLFGREIILLLAVATISAFPMIILLKQKLLGLYAFKPEFNNTWLLLPCLVIMILAYLMVGFQVISASNINPSKLLRDE